MGRIATMASLFADRVNRRRFVGALGLAGASAAGAAVAPSATRAIPAAAAETGHEHVEPAVAAAPPAQNAPTSAEEMDAMHEAGVRSFPAQTEGLGGQPLTPEMDGDVKVFKLTCQAVQWEYAPGQRVEAWTYNGVVPGPEIRVTEGDNVRI